MNEPYFEAIYPKLFVNAYCHRCRCTEKVFKCIPSKELNCPFCGGAVERSEVDIHIYNDYRYTTRSC